MLVRLIKIIWYFAKVRATESSEVTYATEALCNSKSNKQSTKSASVFHIIFFTDISCILPSEFVFGDQFLLIKYPMSSELADFGKYIFLAYFYGRNASKRKKINL